MRNPLLLGILLVAACAAAPGPDSRPTLRIVLQHASATELVPILNEVLTSSCPPEPAPGGWRCITNVQTNSMVFQGTPEQLREISELIHRLDVPAQALR